MPPPLRRLPPPPTFPDSPAPNPDSPLHKTGVLLNRRALRALSGPWAAWQARVRIRLGKDFRPEGMPMRQSIWKLTALVGISGFGFLVLLQVQKSLHDSGVVQAAEMPADDARAARSEAASARRNVHSDPGESPKAAEGGLDFRTERPGTAGLVRTAEADLKPIPQRKPADQPADAADPFAEVDAFGVADQAPQGQIEPQAVISPTAFERSAAEPQSDEAPLEPQPSEPTPAPADGAADFGLDPFADFGAFGPDEQAAEFEEPPAVQDSSSPSSLLDEDDPFATQPTAEEPAGAAPAAEQEILPIEEGATVPIDGGRAAGKEVDPFDAGDDPFNVPDDPFADSPALTPAPAGFDEPGTSQPEPMTLERSSPAAESPQAVPSDDFGSDPDFGTAPAQPPAMNAEPARATEPARGETVPASPFDEGEFRNESAPRTEPASDSPRLLPDEGDLPAESPAAVRGVGTVSPDDPRGPQQARLTVEKKAPERAVLRQPLVYEIVVTNVGESPAHQVTISDVVPKGTELEGTIPRAAMADEALVWNLETIEPGQSSSIKIKVTPVEPGYIGSVATVNFVSEVAARTEIVSPQLSLAVTAPEQVALGQPVDIRFDISNEGSAPAEQVLLRDVLPEGFQHADGNDLEYEVGTLSPGATETVTLRVATIKAGAFTNKAVITAAGGLSAEDVSTIEVADRKVLVTRQGPKRRYVGRPATYANLVRNASNETVRGVKVLEEVPQGMDFVQASHGGQYNADTRTVAWQIGPLQPGQEQTVQVILTAVEEGVQDSTVTVEELEGGTIELTSSTSVSQLPSLAPSMQGPPGPIIVGERTAFRVTLRNRGSADATGVAVSLALPPQLKFVEARGGRPTVDARGVAAVRLETPLPPGGEQVVELVVEGAAPGTARIRAEVNAGHMNEPLVKNEELVVLAPRS